MKFAAALSALAFVTASDAAVPNGPYEYREAIREADLMLNETMGSLIVGGSEVSPRYKYDFITGLRSTAAGSSFCGGALIAPDVILTAAHCVVPEITGPRFVSVNTHFRSGTSDGEVRAVERILPHPDYGRFNLRNDFALLFLEGGISSATPMPLAANSGSDESVGRTATVIGWGAIRENGPSSDVLLEVDVDIISQMECQLQVGGILPSMLCAGGVRGEDACQGDSGGPLFVDKDGSPILVGDVSWGIGCARANSPGVYGRISEARDWIDSSVSRYSKFSTAAKWEHI